MLNLSLALIFSYLAGSIPTAYIFARVLKGIDIRNYGSGNVGATNVYRVIGKVPGFIVLFIDGLKGYLPVAFFPLIFKLDNMPIKPEVYSIIIGAFAIIGHVWTIFLRFKGGKGVATTAGVVLGIMPQIFIFAFLVWVIVFLIFRYVSLASISASISLPIISILLKKDISISIFCLILCIMGIYKHKSNIKRLIKGEESKIL